MTFAEFDIDPASGELRRNGARVKLQDLPFRVLVALVQRPGTVVTRDELRSSLWGDGTFVDAEAGLNTAIAKLREALGDAAETPRFIETIPKRGYRFIATVTDGSAAEARPTPAVATSPGRPRLRRLWTLAALGVVVATAAGWYAWSQRSPVTIAVLRFHNETGDAANDQLAVDLTDAAVVRLAADNHYGVIGNSPLLKTDRIFEDVSRVGAALSARYVVLGQLQRGDRGLLVRAHFVRVSDQTHLWAGVVRLEDTPAPRDAVAEAVAKGVAAGLQRERGR